MDTQFCPCPFVQVTVEVVGSVRKGGEYEHLTIGLISLCNRRIFDLYGNQFFEFREFGITCGVDFYCRSVRSLKLAFVSLQILQPPFNIKVRHLELQALTHLERRLQLFVILGVNSQLRPDPHQDFQRDTPETAGFEPPTPRFSQAYASV